MHPGEPGVEPGPQELQRLAALGVVRRQELGHLSLEVGGVGHGPVPVIG